VVRLSPELALLELGDRNILARGPACIAWLTAEDAWALKRLRVAAHAVVGLTRAIAAMAPETLLTWTLPASA
jgi:hypothetical protein